MGAENEAFKMEDGKILRIRMRKFSYMKMMDQNYFDKDYLIRTLDKMHVPRVYKNLKKDEMMSFFIERVDPIFALKLLNKEQLSE